MTRSLKIPLQGHLLMAWATCCVLGIAHTTTATPLPHIVLIMADDMGYGDPGCYNAESRIPTPHIDRLAGEGLRFTDAHSGGAWCVPARYALMTGRYPGRTNLNLQHSLMEPGRLTLPGLLQSRGYRTAAIGKWHLGFEGGVKNRDFSQPLRDGPIDRGFDTFFGIHASLDIPPYFYIRDDRCVEAPTGRVEASNTPGWTSIQGAFWRAGPCAPGFRHDEVLDRFTREAIEVIEGHRQDEPDRPLFLYLALAGPHTPWLPSKAFEGRSKAEMYGDFTTEIDAAVGKVLEALDRSGMAGETLVLFTSDNGPVWYPGDIERTGHHASGPLRGIKADAWEGGHRVPFVARWPGRVPAKGQSDALVGFTDLMATFAELTGADLPPDAAEDSISFLHALRGASPSGLVRDSLIVEKRMIRQGAWKLIPGQAQGGINRLGTPKEQHTGSGPFLYHLEQDPAEQTNLAERDPEKVAQLRALLTAQLGTNRTAPPPPDPWQPLFDGATLEGWHALPGGKWVVQDGVLLGTSTSDEKRHGLLLTDRVYTNFTARFQFRVEVGNSGFYFRSEKSGDAVGVHGFQAEVDASAKTGGLYETGGRAWVVPSDREQVKALYQTGKWATMEISAIDGEVEVRLNGAVTARLHNDPGRKAGHFALQLHGGQAMKVSYRDLAVREVQAPPVVPGQ